MKYKKIIIVIMLGLIIVVFGVLTVNKAVSPVVPSINYFNVKFNLNPFEIRMEKHNYKAVYSFNIAKNRVLKLVNNAEDCYYFGKEKIIKFMKWWRLH